MNTQIWLPGMDPELHPLWAEQVQLERDMMVDGADAFTDRVRVAGTKENMTQLSPVRHLADDWIPGLAKGIRQWVSEATKQRGVRPIALPYIADMDPHVLAMISSRVVLNYIGQQSARLQTLAMEIGGTVEHEAKIRLWESKAPKLFWAVQHDLDKKKSTTGHRRLVNVHTFNEYFGKDGAYKEFDITWTNWTREVRFRVGLALIDCLIRYTGAFEIIKDPAFTGRPGVIESAPLHLSYKEGLRSWLQDTLKKAELSSALFWPTIMPPKRWTGSRDGGYYTPYVRTPSLIRFKASQEHQQGNAADEYDALEMPRVTRAVNVLQETAWRVNTRVLEAANAVWLGRKNVFGAIPQQEEEPLPPRTPRMLEHREAKKLAREQGRKVPALDEITEQEIIKWKRQASPIHAFNRTAFSRTSSTQGMLDVANKYSPYDELYFPHKLDFRGRMYAIPSYLQPQGNDLAKGLLTFASEAPITESNGGVDWLAIHTANTFGKDKLPYKERIEWTWANRELIRQVAQNPMDDLEGSTEWMKADKGEGAFQFLAAALDMAAYMEQGDGYHSSLPIMIDGTCNGIQHLSAMTRDAEAGYHVNLVPGDKPQDIYKYVADGLFETVMEILRAGGEGADSAAFWLELCSYDFSRSLTKRQVMVLPYGGSRDAFFKYTLEWLTENHMELFKDEDADAASMKALFSHIGFMSRLMWAEVNVKVRGAMKVMKWLQDVAKVAAEMDQPIYWQTPSGFVVRHFYGQLQAKRVKCFLDDTEVKLMLTERTSKLAIKEQLQGIPPNFTHSIDGSCLMETINECADLGMTSFASVHDSYGTHAANMRTLAQATRQAFVDVHETDLLGGFREACMDVLEAAYVEHFECDPMEAREKASDAIDRSAGRLERGTLDIRGVLDSEYFFA